MKTTCAFSQPIVPVGNATNVDLLISFSATDNQIKPKRRSLNLSLVIDRSGSMAGTPLKNAIKAAQLVVERLQPDDILSIVIYDDFVETIFAPQPVLNKDIVRTLLGRIQAGGCTNLSGGWLQGCDHVKTNQAKDKINRVLLLTDGQANVGVTDPNMLIKTAQQQAAGEIATTTLGFGAHFNEDLLIGMANGSGGNFYFIQSPDDLAGVFKIELDSLGTLVAQNLTVTLTQENAAQVVSVLNNYRCTPTNNQELEVAVGDVYEIEEKLLLLELLIPAQAKLGTLSVLKFSYKCQAVTENGIQQITGSDAVTIEVGSREQADSAPANLLVIKPATQLRIARAKEEAVQLADKGDFTDASQKLRNIINGLANTPLHDSFEISEEIDNLDYYAQQIENKRYNPTFRKEMRDQSYQARSRNREDLKLRGLASGSAASLPTTTSSDSGVLVKCVREGAKLRVKVISDGFNPDFNVQFPRSIRQEGVTYVVDEIKDSADGTFYRAVGNIRRLVIPGQEHLYVDPHATTTRRSSAKPKAATAPATAADLETTNDIGTGVLVQCVQEGKKLRARVVSDGYNPDWNIRFPRSIRELGVLYVVDEVIENPSGGSYIACGKIKRLIQ